MRYAVTQTVKMTYELFTWDPGRVGWYRPLDATTIGSRTGMYSEAKRLGLKPGEFKIKPAIDWRQQ